MRRRLAPCLVLALASLGCDGSGQPPSFLVDAGADPGRALREIGLAVARATCAKVDECCGPADRARVLGVGEDFAACEMSLGAFYGRQYGPTQMLVAMERVQFDATSMETCLDAYRAAGCASPGLAAARACAQVFTGAVPDGAACDSSFECASHLCAPSPQGNQCRPRKADGQPCSRGGECASGVCRTSLLAGVCTSQIDGGSCGGDGFWLTL